MKTKTFPLILILAAGFSLPGLHAQQAILASGGDAMGTGGSSSYSVGQVVYTTNKGTNGSVAQGVQQPYEISTVTSIRVATGISLNCIAYPNPVTDILTLDMGNYALEDLTCQLYDSNGKLMENKPVTDSKTNISMENAARGIYFLNVYQNNDQVISFKIIKN